MFILNDSMKLGTLSIYLPRMMLTINYKKTILIVIQIILVFIADHPILVHILYRLTLNQKFDSA